MKRRTVFSRIASLALALVLVFASLNISTVRSYAKEIDESLTVPFGQEAAYDPAQGIGFVWGAAGYEMYTVTITSDNGYNKVYEDQGMGYHWYPDSYEDGKYRVYLQGQSGDYLSGSCYADVTIGNPSDSGNPSGDVPPSEPEKPSQPENPVSNVYADFETMTKSTYKSEADGGWGGDSNVQFAFEGTRATISGDSFGGNAWAVQWALNEFKANGEVNALEFDINSASEGTLKYKFADSDGMKDVKISAGANHVVLKTDSKAVNPFFDLSYMGAGVNVVENMKFVESEADPVDTTIVVDYDAFSFDGDVSMDTYVSDGWGGNGAVNFNFDNGIATVTSDNFGWNAWAVQWKLLDLESTEETNMFEFDVISSTDKSFVYKNEVTGQMNTITLKAGEKLHYTDVVNSSNLNVTFDLTGGSGELKFYNVKFVPVINMENVEFSTYTSETDGGWGGDSGVKFAYDKTKAVISANSFGWNAWAVQFAGELTAGSEKNTLEYDVVATEDKNINFKNENTNAMTTIKLKAGIPYHYSENVDSSTVKFTFDLTGGAGTLTISNLKFGDAGLKATEKVPDVAKQHDFNDTTGDYQDPGTTKAGYELIWGDEFDGNYGNARVDSQTGLNLDNWAYQYGDGTTDCGNYGWGNQELQSYTGNRKNVAVNEDLTGDGNPDGMLRITASYEENGYKYADETVKKYTSGRIRTTSPSETLFTTTYGYVEARIALPEVKGAWPAFWMLPESTEIYGGWPVSGELDILETTGTRTDEACGTLHWGTPAHVYKGSGYVKLNSEIKYFHTYAVDWEPGKITWLYDGEPIYTSTDWASAFGGASDSLTFDAPFDMPYYLILNLAVDSGNFGGAANKANFTDDINMYVDYVRVYQKEEGYAESAVRSAGTVNENWQDVAGKNLIAEIGADNLNTGKMSDSTAERSDWYLATQEDASATANVYTDENGKVWHKVSIGTKGANDYSVQLIGHYDAEAGYVYKVSFDAYAEGGMVGKTVNCDTKEYVGWSTGGITQFALRDKPASYSYTFAEKTNFDNCRVEFNIGAAGTGDVYISNVKVEVVDPALLGISENGREALVDGNMIYNSSFDQGTGHLGYWTAGKDTEVKVPRYTLTDLTGKDVKVLDVASKTNYEKITDGIKYYERRAEIKSVNGSAPSIYQEGIPMTADTYTVKFDMFSDKETAVMVSVCDESGNVKACKMASYSPESGVKEYTFVLTLEEETENAVLKISFAKGAEVYLDNVTMHGANQKSAFDENPVNENTVWAGDNGGGQPLEIIKGGNTVSMVNATSGSAWYAPQLISNDFSVGAGINYKLSFKIKINGNNNNLFEYTIQENGGSWAFAKNITKVDMGTLEKTADGYAIYETEFASGATIANAHLVFGFGGSDISNATVVVDGIDLSIVKSASGNGDSTSDSSESGIDESLFDNGEKEENPSDSSQDNNRPSDNNAANNNSGSNNQNSDNGNTGNSQSVTGEPESAVNTPVTPVANASRGTGNTVSIPEPEVPTADAPVESETVSVPEQEKEPEVAVENKTPGEPDTAIVSQEKEPEEILDIDEEETPLATGSESERGHLIWIIIGMCAVLLAVGGTLWTIRFKKED